MKCKYIERNRKEEKCKDNYFSCTRGICCRLVEWKQKKKTCPYDSKIKSCTRKKKGQKELK